MAGKVKRITQETFDAAVKENMDDFGMTMDDAVKDTIKEFKLQGIDLSNIVTTSMSEGDSNIVASAKRLVAAVDSRTGYEPEIIFLLENIMKVHEGKIMAINNGTVQACTSILDFDGLSSELIDRVLQLLFLLVQKNPIGRDKLLTLPYEKSGMNIVVKTLLTRSASTSNQEAAFKLVRAAATKSEAGKAAFMAVGGAQAIISAFTSHPLESVVIRQAAVTVHVLTNADDYSVTMSKVFDTSRELAQAGLLPLLYQAMRAHEGSAETSRDLLMALKGLAVQNEQVRAMVADGSLELALATLQRHGPGHAGCAARALVLLSCAAENDEAKKELCHGKGLVLMLAAMEAHSGDAGVQRAGCSALGALALRSPENCAALATAGSGGVLLAALETHAAQAEVCRMAMVAIRNLAARGGDELRGVLREAGAEKLVRAARDRHARCADAAFDCLRDLGCEYGGLGDRAGRGEHSAYVDTGSEGLSRAQQAAAGSAMVTFELDEEEEDAD